MAGKVRTQLFQQFRRESKKIFRIINNGRGRPQTKLNGNQVAVLKHLEDALLKHAQEKGGPLCMSPDEFLEFVSNELNKKYGSGSTKDGETLLDGLKLFVCWKSLSDEHTMANPGRIFIDPENEDIYFLD
jgi:hypothetical protein